MNSRAGRRALQGWALYDWANSAYATTVMAGFFPIFFKTVASAGVPPTESTAALGTANSIGVLIVCLAAPFLGAIADAGGHKKKFLALFTALGIAGCLGLAAVPAGGWKMAALVYTLTGVAFAGGLCFYDSLLPSVSAPEQMERSSALGFALGYIGGGILFTVNIMMLARPAWFGLSSPESAIRASFVTVAAWWTIFSLPLFRWVPEPQVSNRTSTWGGAIRQGVRELPRTARDLKQLRTLLLFLGAFFLFNDGVGTTMKMAVDYGLAIGFSPVHLTVALLGVQFIGFPATLVAGRLAERWAPKTVIFLCIGVYLAGILWASRMTRLWEFFTLAAAIGCVQGGIQSISRAFYARLIPRAKAAEFFGFYNLMGKMSGLLGPALVGWVALGSGTNRIGILSIATLFLAGGAVLTRVDPRRGDTERGALEKAFE